MAKIKNPSNKKRYDAYKNSGRRLLNKAEKQKKHEKRMKKFAKRREEGKAYEYKPNPYKEGTEEYILEDNKRASKTSSRLPISKFESAMAKLDNQIKKEKEAKKVFKSKKIAEEKVS